MTPSERLRNLRISLGLSIRDWATHLNMNIDECKEIERGKTPTILYIQSVCIAYSVSADYLLLGKTGPMMISPSDAERPCGQTLLFTDTK